MALKYSLTPSHTSWIWPELHVHVMYIHDTCHRCRIIKQIHTFQKFIVLEILLHVHIQMYLCMHAHCMPFIVKPYHATCTCTITCYRFQYLFFSGSAVAVWVAYCCSMSFTLCFLGRRTNCTRMCISWWCHTFPNRTTITCTVVAISCHTCFCLVTRSQSSTSHFFSSSGISTFTSRSGVGSLCAHTHTHTHTHTHRHTHTPVYMYMYM